MNTRIREEVLDAMEEMEKQMENIRDSAQRAFDAIPRGEEFNAIRNRAEAYWKNGIDNLLDGGMSMNPLASTIGELKELSEEEEEELGDNCRNCGIEIKLEIDNPLALCDDCLKEQEKN